jgi:hypothetical protein
VVVVVVDGTVVVVVGLAVVVDVEVALGEERRVARPAAVVGTDTPRRVWRVATVVDVEVVDDAGSAMLGDGMVVVVVGPEAATVPDDPDDNVDDEDVDPDAPCNWTTWALAAKGANRAFTPAAAVVSPMVAPSDHTIVRASLWTI